MKYKIAVGLLCAYGMFKEIRPVEPFLFEFYLTRGVTASEIVSKITPMGTYTCLATLIPILLLCDTLRYRPILYLECAGYIGCWACVIWSYGVRGLQSVESIWGIALATEVAYYSYVYGIAGKEHYQTVTSYARASALTGRFISMVTAQLIYSLTDWEYQILNYIAFSCLITAALIALCLPEAKYVPKRPLKQYFTILKEQFRSNYSQTFIVKWSLWWALATCGFYQIVNYTQALWHTVNTEEHQKQSDNDTLTTTTLLSTSTETATEHGRGFDRQNLYNGITYAINAVLGAGVAFSVQYIRCIQWKVAGDLVLAVGSAITCAVLFAASTATHLISAYVCFVLFNVCYQCVITIATFNVASEVTESAFGLVVGCNTFVALVLQTILTVVAVSDSGLQLGPRDQFLVYGTMYGVVAIGFTLSWLYVVYTQGGFVQFAKNALVKNSEAVELKTEVEKF